MGPVAAAKSKGFTLIELAVGLVVSISVLGVVGAIFVPSVGTYRNNQAVSYIQENSRYGINTLAMAIDQAGFIGCNSTEPEALVNVSQLESATQWVGNMDIPLRLFPSSADASSVIGATARASDSGVTIGDVITTLSTGSASAVLVEHNAAAETVTFRGNLVGVLDDQIIVLNDCINSAMFGVGTGTYNGATDNTTTFSYASADTDNCDGASSGRVLLGKQGGTTHPTCDDSTNYEEYVFRAGSNISDLLARSYFIAPSSIDGATRNSLWGLAIGSDGSYSAPVELIVGVDNLRARYGVQGSTGAVRYLTGLDFSGIGTLTTDDVDSDGTTETFADVISVEISLMLNSVADVGARGSSARQNIEFPDFNGTPVNCVNIPVGAAAQSACPGYIYDDEAAGTTNGRRLRRVVSKVFNLRNVVL